MHCNLTAKCVNTVNTRCISEPSSFRGPQAWINKPYTKNKQYNIRNTKHQSIDILENYKNYITSKK